jgi:hypothetical protein
MLDNLPLVATLTVLFVINSFKFHSSNKFAVELSANIVAKVHPPQSVSISQYTSVVKPFQSGSIQYKPLGSDPFISFNLLQSNFVEILLNAQPEPV